MRGKTAEDRRLLELLDPVAEAAGYEIVRLRLMGGEEARRLQIMAETPEGEMVVEDCARLSRAISEIMDAADPIAGEYTLEVSSPGVDRPLFRLEHYARFAGESAKVVMKLPQDGRRRLQGTIARIEGDRIVFVVDGAEMAVAFDNIDKARLVPDWAALGLAPEKPGSGAGRKAGAKAGGAKRAPAGKAKKKPNQPAARKPRAE